MKIVGVGFFAAHSLTGVTTGRTIWIVDAHGGNGKRVIVRADEKLTVWNLKRRLVLAGFVLDEQARFFQIRRR